ncbi:hypothetical protein Ccrd_015752 [Cynara cardunculus var. scolymus]|uniref:Glutamate/phenylalanine/leucine/valine/L-tryptophan dehydrogenase C-terminal domain-containing protein n=1 Tax=Cynara cardunculus var. scolymus TaxID=59895 RepID=A0A103YB64_CYNCS|nr:hypothetical protein Ccrd_015752 [Cynara cardunculus var. scolymus]
MALYQQASKVVGLGMNSAMDDMSLIQQRHHLVVRELGGEIDLEIGPGDDDPSFAHAPLIGVPPQESSADDHDENKNLAIVSHIPSDDQEILKSLPAKRKKKVVKRWREEWADTYKWAYVDVKEGTTRIFCSICREYGRKHRRNPYGNEGSRNMQMSALEEHNNSLLHKEALRLQLASKDKIIADKPIYVKALMSKSAGSIVEAALKRDPNELEFIQSVQEVIHALERVISKNSGYVNTMERLLEPERTIIFRVPWIDDRGEMHVNRGFRVQFNQTLGPCRGGLRFHPSMNLSIANYMDELYRYVGPDKDLPSEEMGVGTREMGFLYGQYRRLAGHSQGSFTGPRLNWSGSSLRTEATGYGLMRDSKGYLVDEDGFDFMKLSFLRDIKAQHRTLRDYSKTYARAKYYDEAKPWNERCDVAFPCASQNEIDHSDAISLVVAGELELKEYNLNWAPEDFESKLQEAMKQTYQRALKAAVEFGFQKESPEALVHGAVISAFLTIASSMSEQGCV